MHTTNLRKVGGSVMLAVSPDGADTRTVGVIRCDQPRALDLTARSGKRLEAVRQTQHGGEL